MFSILKHSLWISVTLFQIAIVPVPITAQSGPFATKALVVVKADSGEVPLKVEEKVAVLFIDAIQTLEDDCKNHVQRRCTLKELVSPPKAADGWSMGRLKFDPATADPNYTYTITIDGSRWEASATPKKPAFGGFLSTGGSIHRVYYNKDGAATSKNQQFTEQVITGDSFVVR